MMDSYYKPADHVKIEKEIEAASGEGGSRGAESVAYERYDTPWRGIATPLTSEKRSKIPLG